MEKASQDQAAATARVPLLTLVLNTATLIITAALGMAVGVLVMMLHQTHIDQEHAKAPEARLARDLATIGASFDYWDRFTDIKDIKKEMLTRLEAHFEKWLNR